jgi:undecaprenyl-diphosphatase
MAKIKLGYTAIMLTYIQSIILGVLQGISELFPISSLGHSIILPALVGWQINTRDPYFLTFLVATHLATAVVLLGFYWRDWFNIIGGIVRSLYIREIQETDTYAKLGWLLIVSTIPAGILGLLFEDQIRMIFISPRSAAAFLALNGILLFLAERLRKRANTTIEANPDIHIAQISWRQGLLVGTMQALALIPGFSRTGASLAGGLYIGLSHEDALRFSFLLATPIIGAAAALKIPELISSGDAHLIKIALVGAIFAGLFAYLSVTFLSRYFHTEKHTLTPFAIYCLIAGIAASVYILL